MNDPSQKTRVVGIGASAGAMDPLKEFFIRIGEILHFSGVTHKYLSLPYGDGSLNLFSMIEKHHAVALRLAVDRAAREDEPVTLQLRYFNRNDPLELVKITIKPVKDPISRKRLIAVIFQPAAPQPSPSPWRGRKSNLRMATSLHSWKPRKNSLGRIFERPLKVFR